MLRAGELLTYQQPAPRHSRRPLLSCMKIVKLKLFQLFQLQSKLLFQLQNALQLVFHAHTRTGSSSNAPQSNPMPK